MGTKLNRRNLTRVSFCFDWANIAFCLNFIKIEFRIASMAHLLSISIFIMQCQQLNCRMIFFFIYSATTDFGQSIFKLLLSKIEWNLMNGKKMINEIDCIG